MAEQKVKARRFEMGLRERLELNALKDEGQALIHTHSFLLNSIQ